jgi:shikimate kinase
MEIADFRLPILVGNGNPVIQKSMNIILIGFKSCGKSTLGQLLANDINMTFVDTDMLLEELHTSTKQENLWFREIYQKYGKDYFFQLENQVVGKIEQLDNYVIGSGGGTFINHHVTKKIRLHSKIIYLEVPPEILWERIKVGGIPAFLNGPDPHQQFYQLFHQRSPIYQQLADKTVDVNCDIDEAVERIKQSLSLIQKTFLLIQLTQH